MSHHWLSFYGSSNSFKIHSVMQCIPFAHLDDGTVSYIFQFCRKTTKSDTSTLQSGNGCTGSNRLCNCILYVIIELYHNDRAEWTQTVMGDNEWSLMWLLRGHSAVPHRLLIKDTGGITFLYSVCKIICLSLCLGVSLFVTLHCTVFRLTCLIVTLLSSC